MTSTAQVIYTVQPNKRNGAIQFFLKDVTFIQQICNVSTRKARRAQGNKSKIRKKKKSETETQRGIEINIE